LTQPANPSNPKSKKQLKTQRTKTAQKTINHLPHQFNQKLSKELVKTFLTMGKDLSGTIMLNVQGNLNANSR
jgi:hypothetical protein